MTCFHGQKIKPDIITLVFGLQLRLSSKLTCGWCNGVLHFHTAPLLAFAKLPRGD